MIYDVEKISRTVEKKRMDFIKIGSAIIFFILAALTMIIINFNDYVTVICIFAETILVFSLARHFKRYGFKWLFSKEIRGKNLKEYEYNVHGRVTYTAARRINMPHTYANRKATPLRLNGTVYLELDDGNIKSISGLYKAHMDIYEEGDVLVKYAGTRFPVIVSRTVSRQPCPICGEINDDSRDECRACGLGIVNDRK